MKTDYLRVSVTDRCNLRCIYCNPLGSCDFVEHKEILRLEEIYRIVKLFAGIGIRKVRLTGGEPLVRKNIVYLVEKLATIEAIEDLTLTTNGVLLDSLVVDLKNAGLQRINVSVDSMENKNYKEITGLDVLPKVIRGIYKALKTGLCPVKINSVIMKSINLSQILPLAEMSIHLPIVVRFIEYCPTNRYTKPTSDYVPTSRVREIIEREHGRLSPVLTGSVDGPASCFKILGAAGTIGFISGRSSTFCNDCNRLRLTSEGRVKPCLYSAQSYDIKKVIRGGADDESVLRLLKKILREKGGYTKLNSTGADFLMQKIGG